MNHTICMNVLWNYLLLKKAVILSSRQACDLHEEFIIFMYIKHEELIITSYLVMNFKRSKLLSFLISYK